VELPGGRVQLHNLSSRNNIRLSDGTIGVGAPPRELAPPVQLLIGETTLDIEVVAPGTPVIPPEPEPEPEPEPDVNTPLQTIASPLSVRDRLGRPQQSLLDLGQAPPAERLAQWFETVISVQRAAAGSPEFFKDTAQAVVSLVGLDRGLVILRRGGRWMVQARWPEDDGGVTRGREFSTTVLQRVERERRTFYQSEGSAAGPATESMQGVEAVVASPIFDRNEQVVGMVYGSRSRYTRNRGIGIGPLEAQVMQLLAAAVAAGLARQEQEAEAGKLRVQFEQFFSADLSRELERNPRLLEGQEREVTVLFSDIRGFSRLSEALGPQLTCQLVSYVMDNLTRRIMEHDGVVVDYAGDGIMAMWNAPSTVPDHAVKACRAALAMLGDLPAMSEEWKERLVIGGKHVPLKLGIGLNTGPAMCGNTGCTQRFKYGPLGHTVNLASRVEGATKALGVPLLITGSTRAQIGEQFATRRLCKVRVVGIKGAVDLYELRPADAPSEWRSLRDVYEKSLALYEAADFRGACRGLYALFEPEHEQHDVPSLTLSARAIDALKSPPDPETFDGVLQLESK
jgi:adenylate cyclase